MSQNSTAEGSRSGERKRRHHNRSRYGCISCKQKHMRCDENKPFCHNCLKNGGSCGYTRTDGSSAERALQRCDSSSTESMSLDIILSAYLNQPRTSILDASSRYNMTVILSAGAGSPSSFTSDLGGGMIDPFITLPFGVRPNSNMFLDHFSNYRQLLQEPVHTFAGTQLHPWALTDAALLHATFVLAVKHWVRLGGSNATIESSMYQYKTETIRLVNERLSNPVISDGTIGAVGVLIFVECLEGSPEAAAIHLDGLEKMVHARGDLFLPNTSGLVPRMILFADILTATANNTKPRFHHLWPSEDDPMRVGSSTVTAAEAVIEGDFAINEPFYKGIGFDGRLIRVFNDLHWLSYSLAKVDHKTSTIGIEVLTSRICEVEKYIDAMLRGGEYDTGQRNMVGQSFIVLSGFIYVHLFLKRVEVSNRDYNWMASLLQEELGHIQHTVRQTCSPELLFWILFVGTYASVDRREHTWFKKELMESKRTLGLRDWQEASAVLTRIAWADFRWNEMMCEKVWMNLG